MIGIGALIAYTILVFFVCKTWFFRLIWWGVAVAVFLFKPLFLTPFLIIMVIILIIVKSLQQIQNKMTERFGG